MKCIISNYGWKRNRHGAYAVNDKKGGGGSNPCISLKEEDDAMTDML